MASFVSKSNVIYNAICVEKDQIEVKNINLPYNPNKGNLDSNESGSHDNVWL